MPSERVTKALLSKTDMTEDQIASLSEAEAWTIVCSQRKARDLRLEICFTGFGASKKRELQELATARNFKVVTDITKNLEFLVLGPSPGSVKQQKAERQNVLMLTEAEFHVLAEDGVIPS